MTAPALRRPCDCSARTRSKGDARCRRCGGDGWCPLLEGERPAALEGIHNVPLAQLPAALRGAGNESARLQAKAIGEGKNLLAHLLGNECLLLWGLADLLEEKHALAKNPAA